jgi:hypothetical protein
VLTENGQCDPEEAVRCSAFGDCGACTGEPDCGWVVCESEPLK